MTWSAVASAARHRFGLFDNPTLSREHEVSTTRVSGWVKHSIGGLDVCPTRSRRWY